MIDTILSLAVIAAGMLVWFGVRAAMRPATRLKGVLMVVMAVVLIANVLILTIPVK